MNALHAAAEGALDLLVDARSHNYALIHAECDRIITLLHDVLMQQHVCITQAQALQIMRLLGALEVLGSLRDVGMPEAIRDEITEALVVLNKGLLL